MGTVFSYVSKAAGASCACFCCRGSRGPHWECMVPCIPNGVLRISCSKAGQRARRKPTQTKKRTRERPERAAGKLGWRWTLAIWRDKPCVQRLRSGVKRLLRLPVGQATFGRRRWTPKAQRQDPNANIWGAKTWTPGHLDLGAKRLTFDR